MSDGELKGHPLCRPSAHDTSTYHEVRLRAPALVSPRVESFLLAVNETLHLDIMYCDFKTWKAGISHI
jgi:hypothetical protein